MRRISSAILLVSVAVDAKAQKFPLFTVLAETGTAEVPGPSATLFANPPYQCVRNFYVSTMGSDAAAGTQTAPWKSLRRADTSDRTGGDCINISPGTYSTGVNVKHGGNLASPTGYIVFRCQVLGACKITATGGNGDPAFTFNTTGGPNYVMIDGFELAARRQVPYGTGIYVSDNGAGGPTIARSAHHDWILNNIIHGFGASGVGMGRNDWTYVLHNSAYDNARVTCDAQGSGIGVVVPAVTSNHTPTADDEKWAPFHQVVAWAFFGSADGVTDVNNSWSNNISFGGAPPWGWGPRGNVMRGRTQCPAHRTSAT